MLLVYNLCREGSIYNDSSFRSNSPHIILPTSSQNVVYEKGQVFYILNWLRFLGSSLEFSGDNIALSILPEEPFSLLLKIHV